MNSSTSDIRAPKPRTRPRKTSKRWTGLVRTVWMVCWRMSAGMLKAARITLANSKSGVMAQKTSWT